MNQDNIIQDIHQFREEYARKLNFDINAICKDIQKTQESSGRKIVSFPPRKPGMKKPHSYRLESD